uniref:Regulatory associated protein of MTOR complex 1 n=1 Tax=Salmo trutta TaxID=8032 RepID=A0A673ZV90_SALTR
MDSELLLSPALCLAEEEEADMSDWNLPLAFMKKRHSEKIEGSKALAQSWRMKDRMKTVSVALVLCLNVGVDPPDVVKTSPCARLECWIDPLSMSPQKALETIGANLQKQYENWQPRARYKQSLDPTVDEVKKLCTSLRRNAKEERVLFHYNGHGVPRPTVNGEIWVFNKNYTQYIPLSVYDLQTWMGSPSIFVYDCSNAGIIVKSFKQFALQREQELEVAAINPNHPLAQMPLPPSMKNCIQLAACEASELLPMNPDLPADLFTSCLTTPIKIALQNSFDIKLDPWSVWITLGSPNVEKNFTSAFTTVLAVIVRRGIASGYRVALHIIVSKNWLPDLVFGNGPTQSIITFSNGSPTTGIGQSGARGPVAFSPGNLSTSSSASSTLGSPDNDEYILSFETIDKMRRVSSYSSLNSLIGVSFNSVYTQIWRVLLHLAADPFPEVSDLAMKVLNSIAYKATMNARPQRILDSGSLTQSAPASPTSKGAHIHQAGGSPPMPSASSSSLTNEVPKPPTRGGEQPPTRPPYTPTLGGQAPHSHQFPRTRKMFDKGPSGSEQAGDDADDPGGHKAYMNANLSTGLCDWSAKYFAQPVMKIPEEHDVESQVRKEREWRFLRNARVRKQSHRITQRGVTRLDDQIFINRNPGVPSVVKFHPFNPCIAVADKDSICFWDWEKAERLDYFYNGNPRYTRITAMEYLNGHDYSLLLTATDDGALRIWKNFADQRNPEMVTAWQGLSDMLPTTRGLARRVSIYLDRSKGQGGAGMVVDWEQETGLLMTSGDVRVIRIWDTEREMKVQDIPTGADSCVTSLSCDSQRSLIAAGLGDGSVRLYDRRMGANECRVMTYREHSSWVVKAHLQKQTDGKIISVSVDGDVRFFELRSPDSVNVLQTVKGLTALDIHPQANLFACGSMNQFIAVYNSNGDVISNIKYYDGFMGQRIGAISCLAFHPYWPHLAVGSNDYYMSIYSAEKRLR